MNEFDGYAAQRRGGWWAMLRFARDGECKPLLGSGGEPILYTDELTATKAALRHVLAYFNGHLVSSIEIAGADVQALKFENANRLLFRKGKVIPVQRMKGGTIRE